MYQSKHISLLVIENEVQKSKGKPTRFSFSLLKKHQFDFLNKIVEENLNTQSCLSLC